MTDWMIKDDEVSLATLADAADILGLLRDVSDWLHEIGERQWETIRNQANDDEIREDVAKGNTYIVRRDHQVIATFSLLQKQSEWDIWLWGEKNDAAVYLHKLAVHPQMIGNGFGSDILSWIEQDLLKNEKDLLRLDCISTNENLNTFYEKNGYTNLGVHHKFTLFEKKITKKQR